MMPTLRPYGDHALLIQWQTDGFSETVNHAVQALTARLRESGKYIEIVPGYDSVVCSFDLGRRSMETTLNHVEDVLARETAATKSPGKLIEIPMHYGGTNGPDMATICQQAKLSEEAVIKLHSAQDYRVCMMGFIPGFTFLSPAPDALHYPRLETPRARVAAGSLGIANWQTGIYGLDSPGGWQIIGRTPLSIFDAARDMPFLLNAGDRVRFVPQ